MIREVKWYDCLLHDHEVYELLKEDLKILSTEYWLLSTKFTLYWLHNILWKLLHNEDVQK